MHDSSSSSTVVLHEHLILISFAQAGDQKAFTALFNYYSPGICGYIAGMVRCPEDRDELAMETFFKAWEGLPGLRQASSFKAWLYRIATNVVRDYQRYQESRRLSRQIPLEDYLKTCEGPIDPRRTEESIAEGEIVRQALEEVPGKYRTCLLLEIEGKLSRSEIAEVVGISPASVGVYISKGREYFRQAYHRLEHYANEERRSAS